MTRNYALFVVCVAALVLSAPFLQRNDWQGWVAFCVMLASLAWMGGMWLVRTVENVREWWHDHS